MRILLSLLVLVSSLFPMAVPAQESKFTCFMMDGMYAETYLYFCSKQVSQTESDVFIFPEGTKKELITAFIADSSIYDSQILINRYSTSLEAFALKVFANISYSKDVESKVATAYYKFKINKTDFAEFFFDLQDKSMEKYIIKVNNKGEEQKEIDFRKTFKIVK